MDIRGDSVPKSMRTEFTSLKYEKTESGSFHVTRGEVVSPTLSFCPSVTVLRVPRIVSHFVTSLPPAQERLACAELDVSSLEQPSASQTIFSGLCQPHLLGELTVDAS